MLYVADDRLKAWGGHDGSGRELPDRWRSQNDPKRRYLLGSGPSTFGL